ncbi:TIR domain-containing protein [Blastomonas sp.]|uniref:TIR domain-containing protein n=1 Tax=Blastomonas sp. TaxID=1909299 RepID=UPI0035937766
MTDIFLSYNREDQARAKLFAEAFEAQGFKVWWDMGLRTGEAYDQVTEKALKTAKAVVVLWSKKSVDSRWVRAEATLADRNKTLVPCMIEPCERPIMFELTQTAELGHWQGDAGDRVWAAFLSDVTRFVGAQAKPAATAMPSLAKVAAEPTHTMLAVLPFDNLSSDTEMDYFSDGVSEDILGRIQRASRLKVIGRTSSFQFRGADKPKAAAALNATHVLDGSIRRGGTKVRIAAHLTEAATQTTIWSDKYDRALDDIFAVQDEISEAIAEALDAAFFPQAVQKIDPIAYDLYLRGRNLIIDADGARQAIALLETAVKRAPDFSDAWAALAMQMSSLRQGMPYADRAAMTRRIQEVQRQCSTLDPDNARNAASDIWLAPPFGDFLGQHDRLQTLARVGQNSAVALATVGYLYENMGHNRESFSLAQRALALDPLDELAVSAKCQSRWRAGDFEGGIAAMQNAVATYPDNHHNVAALILALTHQGDWDGVDRLIDPERLAQYPLREHRGVVMLVHVLRNPTPENRRFMLDAITRGIDRTGHTEVMPFTTLAELGFVDEAFALLDRAKLGPSGGPKDVMGANAYRPHLLFPAAYTKLRADPRFVKLCARLGLVEYWLATEKWPDCAQTVPYDFKAECEKYRDFPKDVFFA